MLTLLFIILMFGIFGKMIGLAFRATWGITKIFFRLIFLPLVLIGLVLGGLIYIAAYESLVIYKSLVKHRTFVLLSSFVFSDSFVLYCFLSYFRFLKCFSYFSFVDVSILPYLSLFVIWQSEHIFDCIFIYFLFYQYITSIPA